MFWCVFVCFGVLVLCVCVLVLWCVLVCFNVFLVFWCVVINEERRKTSFVIIVLCVVLCCVCGVVSAAWCGVV